WLDSQNCTQSLCCQKIRGSYACLERRRASGCGNPTSSALVGARLDFQSVCRAPQNTGRHHCDSGRQNQRSAFKIEYILGWWWSQRREPSACATGYLAGVVACEKRERAEPTSEFALFCR